MLGDGEKEAIREEREKENEDFIYRSPENQKNPFSQSWEKQGLCRTREWRGCDFIQSNFVHSLILFILFPHQLSVRETGFIPVDGRLLLAKMWENEDGDMGVWAQAGCSAPSEASPALRIVELMQRRDLHSFSNPCWRHWLLSHTDSSKTGSKKTKFGFGFFWGVFFPPFASFSELLLM